MDPQRHVMVTISRTRRSLISPSEKAWVSHKEVEDARAKEKEGGSFMDWWWREG